MKQILYCGGADDVWLQDPRNAGFQSVSACRSELTSVGLFDQIDTTAMTDQERFDLYLNSLWPSQVRHYRLRGVFGTNKYPGVFFGKQIPALVVFDDTGLPLDVFPHDEGGKYVTIAAALAAS